ncbi:peroxisomal acyl-CoA oxidase (macronuclear) [Tetrahymena thermophila SB210]|uniref:Acyl-coenzyme A oxidase n=1 Tax=Tetrahymena thermophila (strain SB210) TaxID=312017 RepID=I7MHP0_TETTS|nr:peroxisomal acyl-CoA oxidase [Tetrahymena thermophila SB210]EAR89261.1 peroxisomal acyl-CoA oxidase [Tetrahymena thermophila SB210]|eukprot:XP_001009506.1 peroxisomal acyl-CoA oxidase [Tetrahymena thermophila SB210]
MSTNPFKQEREKVSFSQEAMAELLYDGPEELQKFRKYQQVFADDPILKFDPSKIDISRKELFAEYCKKTYRYHELFNQSSNPINKYCGLMFDEPLIGAVHHSMFVPSLQLLADDEQQKRWLQDALQMKIIGCYAQTELAHGSDVQNLQTTSTYDQATDSFILNTPEVGAAKWWVGELGLVANHAIVYAQLIINGQRYGPQPFVVQLRDLKTHKPLPGIDVGDIGPKYGYNSKDNGFLILNNIRIPRTNMLSRYVKVTDKGEFIPAGNPKIVYATMMKVRLGILYESYYFLAAQLTIATRYSLIRKQFKDENGIERTILDYQTQQDKLLPYMADAYAMAFSFKKTINMFQENLERCSKNDFSLLQDLHGLLSAHKSVSTHTTLVGMEKIRQSCGGHGFSSYSGLVGRLKLWYPYSTFEGENTIMLLQTARYLIKKFRKSVRPESRNILPPQCEYLRDHTLLLSTKCTAEHMREFLLLEPLRKMMRFTACFRVVKAANQLEDSVKIKKMHPKEAFDTAAGSLLCDAATSHTHYYIFNSFFEKIIQVNDESIREVLSRLCALYALTKIVERPDALYEGGHINGEQLKLMREAREQLLVELRPEAIGLAEAWSFHDNTLRSAIGSSKGDVYETLLDWVQNKNPVNKPEVQSALHETIAPIVGKVHAPRL